MIQIRAGEAQRPAVPGERYPGLPAQVLPALIARGIRGGDEYLQVRGATLQDPAPCAGARSRTSALLAFLLRGSRSP